MAAIRDLRGDAATPDDERYWESIGRLYDTPKDFINLEYGNFGPVARPVMAAYAAHLQRVNRLGAFYARRRYPEDANRLRGRVAAELRVDVEELTFTRGATEALQALIGGYRHLKAGDAVLYADVDYDAMQTAMRWLTDRRGVEAIKIELPLPATRQNLIDAYEQALLAHPSVRLLLLTHVSHRHGLVLPVKEIAAMARERGVVTILDAAHAWGQVPLDLRDLGVDCAGLNAHKWIGAPLGVGLLWVRRDRIVDFETYMGTHDFPTREDIRDRIHTGTSNFAALLALEEALTFHDALGPTAKINRLTHLRSYWMQRLRDAEQVELVTPSERQLAGAIGAFRLKGKCSTPDNMNVAAALLDRHGVFTVHRTGLASGACIRVTPHIFTSLKHLDRLIEGILNL
jgi:selenocysteine lyase/cysteine desulfurase